MLLFNIIKTSGDVCNKILCHTSGPMRSADIKLSKRHVISKTMSYLLGLNANPNKTTKPNNRSNTIKTKYKTTNHKIELHLNKPNPRGLRDRQPPRRIPGVFRNGRCMSECRRFAEDNASTVVGSPFQKLFGHCCRPSTGGPLKGRLRRV